MEKCNVEKEFSVHMLNEQGKSYATEMSVRFSDLLTWCRQAGQPGREIAIVATKLEEACFFAKKAMAMKSENQQLN